MKLADIHCHVLAGVDDGASDDTMTREMLMQAHQDGIDLIFASSHRHPRRGYLASDEKINARLDQARRIAKEIDPKMEILPGRELSFCNELKKLMLEDAIPTMGDSRYVLIEFSPGDSQQRIFEGLSMVLSHGYRPILAHAERYEILVKKPALMDDLYDLGVLIQLNASSIMGKQGFKIKRFTRRLLKNQMVHFVASDAHHPVYRPMTVSECYRFVAKKYGEDQARRLFYENAVRIRNNEFIH